MKVKVKDKSGRVAELHPKVAKALVDKGRVSYVEEQASAPGVNYQTRALAADPAPYGYKADGTPRKRPGRAAAAVSKTEDEPKQVAADEPAADADESGEG